MTAATVALLGMVSASEPVRGGIATVALPDVVLASRPMHGGIATVAVADSVLVSGPVHGAIATVGLLDMVSASGPMRGAIGVVGLLDPVSAWGSVHGAIATVGLLDMVSASGGTVGLLEGVSGLVGLLAAGAIALGSMATVCGTMPVTTVSGPNASLLRSSVGVPCLLGVSVGVGLMLMLRVGASMIATAEGSGIAGLSLWCRSGLGVAGGVPCVGGRIVEFWAVAGGRARESELPSGDLKSLCGFRGLFSCVSGAKPGMKGPLLAAKCTSPPPA